MPLFNKIDLIQKFAEGGIVKGQGDFKILLEAQDKTKKYDIFLSHSYLQASEIYILKGQLELFGFSVYVDWIEDKELSRDNVSRETAIRLQTRMRNCKSLIYAHSIESTASKWMPWELGYFDGYNGIVAILPIEEHESGMNNYTGQEYLSIYPYITKERNREGKIHLYVNEGSPEIYIIYSSWLEGNKPYKR